MRTIIDRNDRSHIRFHHPIGCDSVKRAAYLSISDVLKKTSMAERQKMIEESPLYDEFKAGTPIESLDLLDYLDLGSQPLDLTDAAQLHALAKKKVEEMYEEYTRRRKASGEAAAGAAGASPASSVSPDTGSVTIL